MSYEAVRAHLVRCKQDNENGSEQMDHLADAIDNLAEAVESDLAQIKGALSHIARLVEHDDNS